MRKVLKRAPAWWVLALIAVMLAVGTALAAETISKMDRLVLGPTAYATARINLAPATAAAGGINFGVDTNLYRSAANTLKTDDALTVLGNVAFGSASTNTVTCTSRLIPRLCASDPVDATPGNRPAGTLGEIARYGSYFYICTNASTPTWAATVVTTGDLSCTGAATFGDAATDQTTVTGDLTVLDDTLLTDLLEVDGNVTLGNAVTDTVTCGGDVTMNRDCTVTRDLTVTRNTVHTGTLTANGAVTLGDASGDAITVTGNTTFANTCALNGATTVGDASTDTMTFTGRMIVRSVTDAGPMTATNGTVAEIVYNTSNSKFYGCTVTGTPATWSALN
jgi:hypothetical protein